MPASTIRAWTLGIICAIIFPGLNQFMFFRWPSTSVGQVCDLHSPMIFSQIINRAVGCTASILPDRQAMGKLHAQEDDLWTGAESGSVQRERTCADHYNGCHGWEIGLRCEWYLIFPSCALSHLFFFRLTLSLCNEFIISRHIVSFTNGCLLCLRNSSDSQ